MLVADCQGGDLVRVSGGSGEDAAFTTSLPHDANRNASGSLSRSYGTEALVMPFVLDLYFDLQAQAIAYTATAGGRSVRLGTRDGVSYPTQRGWYLQLPSGEQAVSPVQFVSGRIMVNSIQLE